MTTRVVKPASPLSLEQQSSRATTRKERGLSTDRHWWLLIALATLGRFLVYWIVAQFYGGAHAAMCHWDCGWYVAAIDNGYSREPTGGPPNYDEANWAFFPAYILVSRLFTAFGLLVADQAATLVSLLSTFGFLVYGFAYARETRGPRTAWLFVALALSFPYGIYFSFPYTESFFLLCSAATLYYHVRRRPYATAVCSAVMTGSRAVGIFFVPVLALERLTTGWRQWRGGGGGARRFVALLPDIALPVVIAPLGLFAFMAFLRGHMGDALAFKHVQVAWGRGFDLPLWVSWNALAKPDFGDLPDRSFTLNALIGLFGVAVGLDLAVRRRFAESWLCLTTILMPMAAGLESTPRFVAGTFPFFLGATDWLAAIRAAWLRRAIIFAFFAGQALFLRYWYVGAHFLT